MVFISLARTVYRLFWFYLLIFFDMNVLFAKTVKGSFDFTLSLKKSGFCINIINGPMIINTQMDFIRKCLIYRYTRVVIEEVFLVDFYIDNLKNDSGKFSCNEIYYKHRNILKGCSKFDVRFFNDEEQCDLDTYIPSFFMHEFYIFLICMQSGSRFKIRVIDNPGDNEIKSMSLYTKKSSLVEKKVEIIISYSCHE